MNEHIKYMQRCLDLARIGEGNVSPNPMVGCVIVCNNKVIGEGFHEKYGEAHAEVNAINSVKDKTLLSEATLYVNLEPCAHFGKTPPCADLILKHRLKKVVIGCIDSFSEVAGKGIEKLKDAGIEVQVGILEKESQELNKRFFTFHTKKRPYIVLKWAQTSDGFIDRIRSNNEKGINWITAPETKNLVHSWRSKEAGILVGWKTIATDNSALTVRNVAGNNPIRIVIDSQLSLKGNETIFNDGGTTIVLNNEDEKVEGSITWIKLTSIDIDSILTQLYKLNIQSIFVEGGKETITHFIESNKWDEVRMIQGATQFENGIQAPEVAKIHFDDTFSFGPDNIHMYTNKNKAN